MLDVLNNGACVIELNKTYITLIPTVNGPSCLKDLRPISLCNMVYILVSKVIVNILKEIILSIIHELQSAFIRMRLITDNILVAFEHFHFLKTRKKSRGNSIRL